MENLIRLSRFRLFMVVGLLGAGACGSGTTLQKDSGADGATTLALPACVRDLMAACPAQGACTFALSDAGSVTRFCFADGTRVEYATVADCMGTPAVNRVTKPDGSLCYTYESTLGGSSLSCRLQSFLWRDAAGNVVANGTVGPGTITVQCTASGESTTCNCAPTSGSFSCQPGACP